MSKNNARSHKALPKKDIRSVGFKQIISAQKFQKFDKALVTEPTSENAKTTEIVVYPKNQHSFLDMK